MLSTVAKLFRLPPAAKIEALARQVAELSLESATALVTGKMDGMSLSEARGYVRARATRIVRRQTRIAIIGHPQALSCWSEPIVRQATEKLVPLVLRAEAVGLPSGKSPRLAA